MWWWDDEEGGGSLGMACGDRVGYRLRETRCALSRTSET